MKSRKSVLFILLFISNQYFGFGQELTFEVKVKAPVNLKADPQIYKSMENDIKDLINKTKWTELEFKDNEKIKGNIQVTINEEISSTSFNAEISVQTSRPVFNTDYTTTLLNYLDKNVSFTYIPGQPLQRSDRSFYDNLSSTISFYAFMVLGFDFDSFALYGGEDYFQSARDVFNALPAATKRDDGGWSNSGLNGRTKYFFMENVLSPKLRPFRQIFYEYHRLALDNMWDGRRKK